MPSSTIGGAAGGVSPRSDRSKIGVLGLLLKLIGVRGVAQAGVVGLGSSIPRPMPSTLDAGVDLSASRAMSMVDGYRRILPEPNDVVGEGLELKDDEGEKLEDAGDSCDVLLLYRNSASSRFRMSMTVTPGGRLKFGLYILL